MYNRLEDGGSFSSKQPWKDNRIGLRQKSPNWFKDKNRSLHLYQALQQEMKLHVLTHHHPDLSLTAALLLGMCP